uniref:Protein pleiotropic regulatory locus 1 n=1 Tax=Rhizophora mucronata TaxID=61149 RepID=A0A2P2LLU0_RHIMU
MIPFFPNFLSSSQQKTIINAMAINEEGVMVTGGEHSFCRVMHRVLTLLSLLLLLFFFQVLT